MNKDKLNIFYGFRQNSRNVTAICLKYAKDNIITIPRGDIARNLLFSDILPYVKKYIYLFIDNKIVGYDENYIIHINIKDFTIKIQNWIILLTTAVNNHNNTLIDTEYRKKLYNDQIVKWLNNTSYTIIVVESSGYDFPIEHERLIKISFKIKEEIFCSTQSESISIKYALDYIKNTHYYNVCTHILKVTGRYYLEGIETYFNTISSNKDLYLQNHRNDEIKWQNSEYYGIKKQLFLTFLESVNKLMEHSLYDFSLVNTYCQIGYFKNNIPRGGDNMVISEL